jgi:hypothetical protein
MAHDISLSRVRSSGSQAMIGQGGDGPMDIAKWLRGLGLEQ